MANQYETLFEAPASHGNSNYSTPEFESEWETASAFQNEWETNPEFENEWEASGYEMTNEWETNPEFENEWEASGYEMTNEWETNPGFENEWEANSYGNPELSPEGEYFFKSLGRGLKSLAKVAAPLAKRLAPIAAGTLASMIPGVGAIAGPLAGKLTAALVREAEMEVATMEANLFGTNEAEAEVANSEVGYEAALTEFLAAQAAESSNQAEAEAAIAAALPITISIMGGKRALRPVMPVMVQATGRLTRVLGQQGAAGKQLLRTMPRIQRQTVAMLKAAARAGQPINSSTALRAMATATNRVLSNPSTVQRAVIRNAVLRQRTAPPHLRRPMAGMSRPMSQSTRCPNCSTRAVR